LKSTPNSTDEYEPLNTTQMDVEMKQLDELSAVETEYYSKCKSLVFIMTSAMHTDKLLQHDNSHANSYQYCSEIAEVCSDHVNELMTKLVSAVKRFPTQHEATDDDTKDSNEKDMVEILIMNASVKEQETAQKEVETLYDGNWLRMVDLCSSKMIFHSFKELYFMLLILAKYNMNCCGFEMVSFKQTIDKQKEWPDIQIWIKPTPKNVAARNKPTNVNYMCTVNEEKILSELRLNLAMDDEEDDDENEEEFLNLPGHICKVSLLHKSMYD